MFFFFVWQSLRTLALTQPLHHREVRIASSPHMGLKDGTKHPGARTKATYDGGGKEVECRFIVPRQRRAQSRKTDRPGACRDGKLAEQEQKQKSSITVDGIRSCASSKVPVGGKFGVVWLISWANAGAIGIGTRPNLGARRSRLDIGYQMMSTCYCGVNYILPQYMLMDRASRRVVGLLRWP